MNNRRIVKSSLIFVSILFGLFLLVSLMISLSPYKNHLEQDYKSIHESILIKAPVKQVFEYLGNSDNAKEWSVYVDHISTLNSNKIPDGEPGSIRKCFVNRDEKGKKWDEEVLISEPNKRRRLSCYEFNEFEITAGTLFTEQIYEETNEGYCFLTFTLYIPQGQSTLWKDLKMHFGSYVVANIFEKNLINIKRYNEHIL